MDAYSLLNTIKQGIQTTNTQGTKRAAPQTFSSASCMFLASLGLNSQVQVQQCTIIERRILVEAFHGVDGTHSLINAHLDVLKDRFKAVDMLYASRFLPSHSSSVH